MLLLKGSTGPSAAPHCSHLLCASHNVLEHTQARLSYAHCNITTTMAGIQRPLPETEDSADDFMPADKCNAVVSGHNCSHVCATTSSFKCRNCFPSVSDKVLIN